MTTTATVDSLWDKAQTQDGLLGLIETLAGWVSSRKLRLFGAACCRAAWDHLDPACRHVVEVAERHADGKATAAEVAATWEVADATVGTNSRSVRWVASRCATDAWWAAMYAADMAALDTPVKAALLREIVGDDPYHAYAVTVDPQCLAWQDGVVHRLAVRIYADRDWSALPILADALEEAGCENADLLDHLRSPGPHVRGCWALDVLCNR